MVCLMVVIRLYTPYDYMLRLGAGRRSIIARIITNSFTTDFGPEKVTLDRHLETLKNETTLSHRLHIHEFIAENRAQPGPNTGLLLDIEEVLPYIHEKYVVRDVLADDLHFSVSTAGCRRMTTQVTWLISTRLGSPVREHGFSIILSIDCGKSIHMAAYYGSREIPVWVRRS